MADLTPCPGALALNGHPCGCGGRMPSHYPDALEKARREGYAEALGDAIQAVSDCAAQGLGLGAIERTLQRMLSNHDEVAR